jgi:hypothetical protein
MVLQQSAEMTFSIMTITIITFNKKAPSRRHHKLDGSTMCNNMSIDKLDPLNGAMTFSKLSFSRADIIVTLSIMIFSITTFNGLIVALSSKILSMTTLSKKTQRGKMFMHLKVRTTTINITSLHLTAFSRLSLNAALGSNDTQDHQYNNIKRQLLYDITSFS